MNFASVLFLLAAVIIGLTLLLYILKNKNTPKALVFSHGFFATLGLLALIVYALFHQIQLLMPAAIFVVAAMGGLILAWRDLIGLSLPKSLAIGHGLIALLGIIVLFCYML